MVGLIIDNEETVHRLEVTRLAKWCEDNNLVLNTSKAKELIIDFRRTKGRDYLPLYIHGNEVECVNDLKFLGVTLSRQLTWSSNTSHLVQKTQQRLFFLRKLKRVSSHRTVNFHRSTIKSITKTCTMR